KKAGKGAIVEGAVSPDQKNPIRMPLPACCAHAASGHAAAPPMSVMNSRRLMSSTASLPQSVCRTLSLPQNSRRVLWTDLNRSESRLLPLAPTRGPLLCACPWGRGPVWVRLGHSAMSARCPVCPKADRAGQFISTRLKLEQAALTAYTGQEDCNSHEAHGWGARHDTGGRLLLPFRALFRAL